MDRLRIEEEGLTERGIGSGNSNDVFARNAGLTVEDEDAVGV